MLNLRAISVITFVVINGCQDPHPNYDLLIDTGSVITGDDSGHDQDEYIADDTSTTTTLPIYGPTLYPNDRIQSPITAYVADRLLNLSHIDGPHDNVFMKVGASSTVSSSTLHCFAGSNVELDIHESELIDTLDYFLTGDAQGSTPFDRSTLAAISGKTAAWVIDGNPSPLDQETAAISPRIAIIHYGTNDMGMGSTPDSAMPNFHDSMMFMIDHLLSQGIVPVLTGISHRGDSTSANRWVNTYNTVIRGMAQRAQVPFIDLHLAMDPLQGHGLAGDGIHLNGYAGGPCVLTQEGLQHGYPTRNLIVLEALDRLHQVLNQGVAYLDPTEDLLHGDGAPQTPFEIPSLPFTDSQDTDLSPHDNIDVYTGCAPDTDESGPEYLYTLQIDKPTRIRAMVLDEGDVDIDIHLLDSTGSSQGCLARAHRTIEMSLEPGQYTFSLDTWVDATDEEMAGEYLFVVLECNDDDSACDTTPNPSQ